MTKPANFPGRKNVRRVKALAMTANKKNKSEANFERAVLLAKIVPQQVAESIRTKKDRSARASFRSARA